MVKFNKKFKIIAACVIFIVTFLVNTPVFSMNDNDVNVLVILPVNYGANYFLNLNRFEEFGWNVTTASLTASVRPCPAFAGPLGCPNIQVDTLLSEIEDITAYDGVAVMSATYWVNYEPCRSLMLNTHTLDLIQTAVDSGLAVAGWCSGVRVLGAANVLNGVNVTGSWRFEQEFINAGANWMGANHFPVIDGNIVTCARGHHYYVQNCNAFSVALESSFQNRNKQTKLSKSFINTLQVNNDSLKIRTIGGENADGGAACCSSNDGGLIVTGYTFPGGNNNSDLLLMKLDSNGAEEWINTFGGAGFEYGKSVIFASGGGYVVCGNTTSIGAGSKDIYVIKTDEDGNEIWTSAFGGSELDIAESMIETSDGNFLVCGYTESFGAGDDDIYLIKINENGEEVWSKTFGGTDSEVGLSVIEYNSNYYITGFTGSYGAGHRDIWFIKTDMSGNVIWDKTYGYANDGQWGVETKPVSDGFVIAGSCDSLDTNGIVNGELMDAYILKTDFDGNLQWKKRIGESTFYDYGRSVIVRNNEIYLLGNTESPTNQYDLYLIKLSHDGEIEWKKTFGEAGSDRATGFYLSDDNNLFITGQTNSYGTGSYDAWLSKISSSVLNIPEEKPEVISSVILYQNYPNPFNPNTTIKFELSENGFVDLCIYNIGGQLVKKILNNERCTSGINEFTWDGINDIGRKVSSGIYFIQLSANNGFLDTKKMVLIR